jgi:uracil-DNA glycosylase family 4
LSKQEDFFLLCEQVESCNICERMSSSSKIMGLSSGKISAKVMFIGEAPGRLGADDTGIPFHGDKSGQNFEFLLDIAGVSREQIFVTNAVLCNPRNELGNNATPCNNEIQNCSNFLRQQIDLIDPCIVVSMGATALSALSLIEPHNLMLKNAVRTENKWYGRVLIPVYHPGQRAMLHRSFANQSSDYRFIAEKMKRLGVKKKKTYGKVDRSAVDLIQYILSKKQYISYFAVHKIAYLVEYQIFKKYQARYTNAYFIRQKDGPYCTDLHIKKLKNSFKKLKVSTKEQKLYIEDPEFYGLFTSSTALEESKRPIDKDACRIVDELVNCSDTELKQKAYLSTPMKRLLRRERKENCGTYNEPIEFEEDAG